MRIKVEQLFLSYIAFPSGFGPERSRQCVDMRLIFVYLALLELASESYVAICGEKMENMC